MLSILLAYTFYATFFRKYKHSVIFIGCILLTPIQIWATASNKPRKKKNNKWKRVVRNTPNASSTEDRNNGNRQLSPNRSSVSHRPQFSDQPNVWHIPTGERYDKPRRNYNHNTQHKTGRRKQPLIVKIIPHHPHARQTQKKSLQKHHKSSRNINSQHNIDHYNEHKEAPQECSSRDSLNQAFAQACKHAIGLRHLTVSKG